ncbi:hypothetical protein EPUS_00329 [Endocarpon pusillum Z07020]|uniref:Uncharacterized protein n=1 Tax=Endocarpon pusillum (strain Z07020 / HMAS-L-300199) TaxID=1263415 RepID=U1FZ14_ENDPU|nr:uncharacterized protein EPUS_00329 [Endocarpon pusillum Z07020]ERF70142.1 hypothetical protein EPUS_00329 [Endocarpon pusillum Z07020]
MASDRGAPKISIPSEADLKQLTEDERLMQAAQVAKAADSAQCMVDSLKSKAALLTDPKERERVLSEMYDQEIEAKGLSKKARILKSGTFQGAAREAQGSARQQELDWGRWLCDFGADDGSGGFGGSRGWGDSWAVD